MSGGPVFGCEIAAGHIHCRLLGVVHGSNLIEENGDLFFKGLIAAT
jgi:hypothetical protein